MARSGSSEDFVTAPGSYDELFRQYYPYVVGLVRKLGIDDQRKEDVACEILLRFYERDFLAQFDSSKVFEYNGQVRPARFKSFLSGFVAVYVKHHRDRQGLMLRREPLTCDQPVGEGGTSWIEVFGPSHMDDYSTVEEAELVSKIRLFLVTVPRRSRQDVCDLPLLFDHVVSQVRLEGKIDVKKLQAVFGVSNTAIHSWIARLREQVGIVVGAEQAAALCD